MRRRALCFGLAPAFVEEGEARLAIDLAGELWPLDRLSSGAAVELAESGLTSGDHETQYSSAMLLRNNTNRLYRSETQ